MSWKNLVCVAAIYVSIALSAAGCSPATPDGQTAIPAAGNDPAVALVQRFKMGAGLESLANQAAGATTTFAMLAQQHGAAEAKRLVGSEISKLLPAYQVRWDRNLATIYAKHFTADELRSLATQGTRSPHNGKFRSTQATVAAEMREVSSPLLQELVMEALRNVLQR
ncbi:hypothetical protein [Luteimonas sp. FCS-9]|uniref:hypothetical protein n=1 Tax=Luteimonas sp. FCS-9 TaxID=1547516 RepID=UPI000AD1B385|nr:hypothetical protein [Luteimonas sp. FCS-9]